MSDAEWAYIEPMLPPVPKDGRPEKHDRRDIVDAILYVTHNGIVWRTLPADFPPWKTVYGFFDRWKKKGLTIRIHDGLRGTIRQTEGRAAGPTAGVIDSQSIKGSQTVSAATRGYDAGKKVNGRKRFIVVGGLARDPRAQGGSDRGGRVRCGGRRSRLAAGGRAARCRRR